MNLVSLEDVQFQLNITSEDGRDNELLSLIPRASGIVLESIPDDLDWMETSPIEIPESIRQATLLVIGEMFMNREASLADILSTCVRSLTRKTPGIA